MVVATFYGRPSDIGDLEHCVGYLHNSPDTTHNMMCTSSSLPKPHTTDHMAGSLSLTGGGVMGGEGRHWGEVMLERG